MTVAYVDHDTRDGVLCWGGPEHGRVVPIPPGRDVWLFPVERRYFAATPLDVTSPALASVRYNRHRFAAPWPEVWPVLVYAENEDFHKRGLEASARFVLWLAGWNR